MLHPDTSIKLSPSKTKLRPKESVAETPSATHVLEIGGEKIPLVSIKHDGNLLLDVKFPTSQDCIKSIPKDALKILRNQKNTALSPRILYRVEHETLTEISGFFRLLLSSKFAEGIATQKTLEDLIASGLNPAQVDAEKLPKVTIVDEDLATKTIGREKVFTDLLRVTHGLVSYSRLHVFGI